MLLLLFLLPLPLPLSGARPKQHISTEQVDILYESIRSEVRDKGFDEFQPTWGLERDFTDHTTELCRTIHPPFVPKEEPPPGQLPKNSKFSNYLEKNAAYWRVWKHDVDILEDVSSSKLIKKIQHDQRMLDGKGKLRLLKYEDGREMSTDDQKRLKKLAKKYAPRIGLDELERIWNSKQRLSARYPNSDAMTRSTLVPKFGRDITIEEKNRPSMIAPGKCYNVETYTHYYNA